MLATLADFIGVSFKILCNLFLMAVFGIALGQWAVVIYAGLWFLVWRANRSQFAAVLPPVRRARNAGAYGDAGFATQKETAEFHAFDASKMAVPLGLFVDNYTLETQAPKITLDRLGYGGENNLITIGGAGTGKGTTAVIPALLTINENVFVLDIKGQNFAVTHFYRLDTLKHDVIKIDPFDAVGDGYTNCFNPLQPLIFERGTTPPHNFAANIKSLGHALIISEGKEPHWINRGRNLVVCLMAHLCSTSGEIPTLPRVREILGLPRDEFTAYMMKARENPLALVRDNAGAFCDPTDTETKGIISTVIGQLDFLHEPAIARFLEKSDFDFLDLRRPETSIYLIIPPELLDTYSRFVRLLVQSFFNAMLKPQSAKPVSVLAILDEQAKLGYMPIIEDSAALLRDYRVRIWSIFQDLNQIKSLYEKRWETFLSNAGIQQFFTPNDATTAEYVSRKIGNHTVPITTTSQSSGFNWNQNNNGGGSGESSGSSQSTAVHGLPFMTSQDLYGLPKGEAIIFVRGLRYPVRAWKQDYRFDTALTGRWDADPFHL